MSEVQHTGAAIDMFDVLHDSLDLDSTGSVVECKNGERYITMYSGGVKYIASEGDLLAKIDSTLVGQPGSVIKLPYYSYIGDAAVVAEGADIPIKQLSETTVSVQISKIGNGVQISDEAILSGYGDPRRSLS